MRIPVVFATDENYIFYTCVAITSLARNAAYDTVYDISVLVGRDFPGNSLLEKAGKRYSNINIRFICLNPDMFRDVTIHNGHVTRATFYRLVLGDLLPEEDRCIYLDSDIIVTEDLQPLYTVELNGNYIAGCRDVWIDMLSGEEREERRVRTGLPSMEYYVNGGVLVMNLRRIREDGIDKMFVKHLSKNYPYEDQDIMNVCCYGRILHLPAKWNIFTLFLGQLDEMREKGIDRSVLEAFGKRQGIIHYATPFIRPWEHAFCWANWIWWDTASEWAEEPCYQELHDKVWKQGMRQRQSRWPAICRNYQKIVVFGFTVYGKEVCDWLLDGEFGDKLQFCDNNPDKHGIAYRGIRVFRLDECEKEGVLFINTSQKRRAEVNSILRGYGIREEDILCYRGREEKEHYRYLDSRYYLEELKDIFCREYGPGLGNFREDLPAMRKMLAENPEYADWQDCYFLKEWILKE